MSEDDRLSLDNYLFTIIISACWVQCQQTWWLFSSVIELYGFDSYFVTVFDSETAFIWTTDHALN